MPFLCCIPQYIGRLSAAVLPPLASIIAEVQEKCILRIVYLARAAVFAPVFIGLFDGSPGFCLDGYAFKPKRKLIFKIAQDR